MSTLGVEEILITEPAGRNIGMSNERINIPQLDADVIISSTTNVTAAGTIRADATQLTDQYSYVAVPVNDNGVVLPQTSATLVGQTVTISNTDATNNLLIYPYSTSESIAGGGAGNPYSLGPGELVTFNNSSLTTWSLISSSGVAPAGILILPVHNTFVGDTAGNSALTGTDNTGTGYGVLNPITSGNYNTGYGSLALALMEDGSNNTMVGAASGSVETSFNDCTAVGYNTLLNNFRNEMTAVGSGALAANTSGRFACAMGFQALSAQQTLDNNSAFGHWTLRDVTTGTNNCAFGSQTIRNATTVTECSAFGAQSLQGNTLTNCVAVGYQALRSGSNMTNCIAIGFQAHTTGTGVTNAIAIGSITLSGCTGTANTAVGHTSQSSGTTTSANNTSLGYRALLSRSALGFDTAVGSGALTGGGGGRNTAFGYNSLTANLTGTDNLTLGYNSGSALTSNESNNICVMNVGVALDAGYIRFGTAGTHVKNFTAGIRGITTDVNDAIPVLIDSAGQLGTLSSAARKKNEIGVVTTESDFIHQLIPKMFTWKDVTKDQRVQIGLIADEVEKINPFYVSYGSDGLIETVKYFDLITPILSEVQKNRKRIIELERMVGLMSGSV